MTSVPDLINASFEFLGAFAVIANIKAIRRDKQAKGFSILPVIFFVVWGFWNVFYYPSLGQYASAVGGLFIASCNSYYLYLVLKYRKEVG